MVLGKLLFFAGGLSQPTFDAQLHSCCLYTFDTFKGYSCFLTDILGGSIEYNIVWLHQKKKTIALIYPSQPEA